MTKESLTYEQKDDLVLEALENATEQLCVRELMGITGMTKSGVDNSLKRQEHQIIKQAFMPKKSFIVKAKPPKFSYVLNSCFKDQSIISKVLLQFYALTQNRELEVYYE